MENREAGRGSTEGGAGEAGRSAFGARRLRVSSSPASIANRTTSAAARPLPLRMRPDLVIVPQHGGSEGRWLVKDPLRLSYFHLGEEEHAILTMLDGQRSLRDLQRGFEGTFAPLHITLEQLHGFVGQLYQSGLLVGDSPGQAEALLQRRWQRRRMALVAALSNALSIRLRGIDPEPALRWLYPRVAWIFSPWFLLVCLALVVWAMVLAAVEFDDLLARLSQSAASWTPGRLAGLAVALALAKGLHEVGHALTCKHFGGECHEIGLLLLIGTPCLYCDVSDAWRLPDKWHRIAISAAGILTEIVLASVCLLLWWGSEPGLLNTLLLNTVILCSVNTLFLNGNPLLRYDGYFVLADWLDLPNLSQHARAVVSRGVGRFLLGLDTPSERYLPQRLTWFVGIYGVASLAYRWCVVVAVLWMLHRILKPYGLEVLATGVAVAAVAGLAGMPIVRLGHWLFRPATDRRVRPGRAAVAILACLLLVATGLLVPLPRRVSAPLVAEPQDARYVYAVVPGRLVEAVAVGSQVAKDQVLAQLSNPEIDREVADLAGLQEQQRQRLEGLRLRLLTDPSVATQIPSAEESLADVTARWHERQLDQGRLVIRAPAAGTVIAAPRVDEVPYQRGALGPWRGGLLETKNRGATVESGTLLCLIGDPTRLEATAVVDQADMEFVRVGQRARIRLDALPGRVCEGTIVGVAKIDLKIAPRELAAAQSDLAVRRDHAGTVRPASTSYQARMALSECPAGLLTGSRGQARIVVAPQSLASRLTRSLSQVFRFRW